MPTKTKEYFEKLRKELRRIRKKRQYKGQHYKFSEILASLPDIKNKSLSKEKNFEYQYEDQVCPTFTFKRNSVDVKYTETKASKLLQMAKTIKGSFAKSPNMKIQNWVNFEFFPRTSKTTKRNNIASKASKRKKRLAIARESSVRLKTGNQSFKRPKKIKENRSLSIRKAESSDLTSKKSLSPINEPIKPKRRKIVKETIYIDKSKAVKSVYNCIFKKGPINIDYLNDDSIFKELENGLSNKELTWLSNKRAEVIEKYH
ncbi:unnamed protein product [Moneuplotes crassus]|uniref:Uncharacterized protein n=1 Tax=Euplotes crassus TaxID=5936 RepID=A0AAD1Y919_EUPCR|nr:unnamed protein product [Moneuplotes crassus]